MSDNQNPMAKPVVLQAPSSAGREYEEVRLPLTERELARERLRAKVDVLTETASLKGQLQREPLKMLGGASAVGAVVGLLVGSQMKRTKTVYVDANSPLKYQKGLMKAQKKEQGTDLGGALVATLVTAGARALGSKVVQERLHALADDLLAKAGEAPKDRTAAPTRGGAGRSAAVTPARASNPVVSRFIKSGDAEAAGPSAGTAAPAQAAPQDTGPVRHAEVPGSRVEAKADGSPIQRSELQNPNQ